MIIKCASFLAKNGRPCDFCSESDLLKRRKIEEILNIITSEYSLQNKYWKELNKLNAAVKC